MHSHASTVIPFSVSSVPLRPVHHVSGFSSSPTPVFDLRRRQRAIALGGEVTYLDPDEAALADAVHVDVVARPGSLWRASIRGGEEA